MDELRRYACLSNERWRRGLARAGKKKLERAVIGAAAAKSNTHGYRSPILDLFGEKYLPHANRRKHGPKSFKIPRIFSLTENAEKTISVVSDIAKFGRSCRRPRINIDHRQITSLGLGAEAFLAVILKEISRENEISVGSRIRGYKPQNPRIIKMMDEIGCARVLKTGLDEDIKVSLRSTSNVFRHQNRGKDLQTDALTADPIAKTTKDFSDHLDSCLALTGRRLSPKGRDRLLAYVAEVLINAQEHSGTSQWTIVGFVDEEDRELVYRAAIFSLGKTIAQTFKELDVSNYSWSVVSPYLERHRRQGFFGRGWKEDDLLAVVSLQENISSKLVDSDSDRGQGTVDLIEFFQDISYECAGSTSNPLMTIISGRTQIRFDGQYRMRFEESVARKIIAFNEDNSLFKLPDSRSVRSMEGVFFPGVMISLAVPLAASSVESIPIEVENENRL